MELTEKISPAWLEVAHGNETLRFLCAPLTPPQKLSVGAMCESAETFGEGCMAAVRYAVRDWQGITRKGEPVPFSRAALEQFFTGPELVSVLLALAGQIITRSTLSEDERKNS